MNAFVAQDNPGLSALNADTFWLSALALLGAAVGVYLFFYGFRMLQYKRRILNTPFSRIRSASMGLVEVSGTPTGPNTISAPITGAPCYYYRARGWQWRDSGKGGSWQQVVDESVSVPFFLEDGTGKVLVNPQGANLDVHRSFYDEFRTTSLFGQNSAVPETIRKFAAMRGLMGGEKVRLEEHIIKPGFPLFVFGTLGENTLRSWQAQSHISGKKMSFGFNLGDVMNLQVTRDANIPNIAAKTLAGLLQNAAATNAQTSIRISRSDSGPIKLPDRAIKALQEVGENLPGSATYTSQTDSGPVEMPQKVLNVLQQAGLKLPSPVLAGSGKVTVSNHTMVGGMVRTSSVTMTIPTDQSAAKSESEKKSEADAKLSSTEFDLRAPVAISNGERGEPFTISSQSQREVVKALGWKAVSCIWGGPIFALICLYSLLSIWGWL